MTKKARKSPRIKGLDTSIPRLGTAKIPTCLPPSKLITTHKSISLDVSDHLCDRAERDTSQPELADFEVAGPRQELFFDAPKTKCAIVTCGGLCPGINDVIRAIVMEAHHNYRVASTVGIRFGLQGFIPSYGHDVDELTPDKVSSIHHFGGTILGSSRGPQPPEEIVDALARMNVNVLFIIGGDGTMRAASAVQAEVARRQLSISIIGIPKTIDNDISFISQSFGFDTAVGKATEAIECAHVEATGLVNGVGIVKLMGRESGFIAAQATMALKEVNFVLVPEVPFKLDGEDGFLTALERRLEERTHAVIVCAEGAGQNLLQTSGATDPSGNPILGDICSHLIKEIKGHFASRRKQCHIKFIDPSYIIRSVPANANDRVYCGFLGQYAVHAAMSGRTGMVVGKLMNRYVHLPFRLVTKNRRQLNVNSEYWRAVMESTGQPLMSIEKDCEEIASEPSQEASAA
jgi:6-phosphofructokinase 1